MEENNIIEIENLVKEYKMYNRKKDRLVETLFPNAKRHKNFKALDGITLNVKKGEVLGILGKNGAGKSTLLKIITGVVTQTSGTVKVKGKVSSLLELGAAFNLELTGEQNIYEHGQVMGLTREEIEKRKQDIINFADIGEHLYQPVKTYSSGMFARLAFACAINVDPDILIVDEVLSVGDISFQLKCIKRMKEMMEKGVTILYVSHSPESIMALCNRAMWILDGKVHAIGDVKNIVKRYNVFMSHGYIVEDNDNINNQNDDEDIDSISLKQALESGNKDAIIENVKYSLIKGGDDIIENWEEEQEIELRIKANKDIENPIYGFTISNKSGLPIFHMNTYSADFESKKLEANKEYEVKLKFKLPRLNQGQYALSIGLDNGIMGVSDIIHRLDNVVIFKVLENKLERQYGIIYIEDKELSVKEI